ncbi:MAG: hypothetical protein ACAH83_16615 [Alphaproteobacteria bacterium]
MADGGKVKSIDELLADARKLKNQVGATAQEVGKTDIKGSVAGDALKKVKVLNDTAEEVQGGMSLVKETGKSIWHFLGRTWPVRGYKWLFKKICYKKDKETGELTLRPNRAKAMVLTTAFLASAAIPGMIGVPARATIGAIAEPIFDGSRMVTMMHKEEIMYLNDQHVVDHKNNVWVVKGTTKADGDVNDAVLFNVKPSLMNDLWSWKNKGNPFFIPDQVVAPVAPGANNKYIVTYYGHRWRLFTWLQAYPELLDVKAIPADFNGAAKKEEAKPPTQQEAPAPTVQHQNTPAPKAPGGP